MLSNCLSSQIQQWARRLGTLKKRHKHDERLSCFRVVWDGVYQRDIFPLHFLISKDIFWIKKPDHILQTQSVHHQI